jgi:signal transduction histidine kinase
LKDADNFRNRPLIDSLEKIKLSCERMSKMVNSLEQFMSLEGAEKMLEKVDLDDIVMVARNMAIQSTSYTGELVIRHKKLPEIAAARNQMEILFYNLIENAVKFRKPGHHVNIDISYTIFQENRYKSLPGNYRYHDVVKILFTDNGKGFDTDHSNNLFKLFQKLQSDTMGVGLGLALCKKIIDNHFGEISLDSEPGEGTTFTILLPLLN